LDEWRTRNGINVTKSTMLHHTKTYLSNRDVHNRLLQCARDLVRIRRRRAETDRWERFARELSYYCHEEDCKTIARRFPTRNSLRKHAWDAHGFVWELRIANAEPDGPKYACTLDQCQLAGMHVFKKRRDYQTHLKIYHGIQKVEFQTRAQLEAWLDRGRTEP
ncbi:hypothetical protein BCR34DRAFT_448216, partial [Clohesyomyces aquaticus]